MCGKLMGWKVRQRLLAKQAFWKHPGLLTLTMDRRNFKGPREAWEAVTNKRAVAELMRMLGITRWMWVLEFQQKTGDGWPHWHCLVDLEDLPGHRINLKRAWAIWRDKWKLGGLDLTEKSVKVQSPKHAINYLTKYLTKLPEGGFPEWVLGAHSLRFLGGCRALGALVSDGGSPSVAGDQKKTYRARRSHLDRVAECGLNSRVWALEIDKGTGEEKHRFLGSLPCMPEDLVVAMQNEKLAEGTAETVTEIVNEQGREKITIQLPGEVETRDVTAIAERMKEIGYTGKREERTQRNREHILKKNVYRNRYKEEAAGEGAGTQGPASGCGPAPHLA